MVRRHYHLQMGMGNHQLDMERIHHQLELGMIHYCTIWTWEGCSTSYTWDSLHQLNMGRINHHLDVKRIHLYASWTWEGYITSLTRYWQTRQFYEVSDFKCANWRNILNKL